MNMGKCQTRGKLKHVEDWHIWAAQFVYVKKCMALPLNIQVNEVMGRSHDIGKLLEI